MSLIHLTMESIVYNRVALKEFLNSGGFSKFPGIKVSKNGRIYLTRDGKSAPLMIDAENGDVIIRGCYERPNDSGYKLLTVFPATFTSSAVELFHKWASARSIDGQYRLLLQDRGNTYINYKHSVESETYPVQAGAFGFIPSMYSIDADSKIAGLSYRVCPSHVLTFSPVEVSSTLEDKSDEEFVVEVSEETKPAAKRARTSKPILSMVSSKK